MKRIKTSIKILVFILVLTITAAGGAAVLIYKYLPEDKVIHFITEKAESILKMDVNIQGINYNLDGISVYGVTIKDTDSKFKLMTIEKTDLSFSLIHLLKKELKLENLVIHRPTINLKFENEKINLEENINKIISSNSITSNIKVELPDIEIQNAMIIFTSVDDLLKPLNGSYTLSTNISIDQDNKTITFINSEATLPSGRGNINGNFILNYSSDITFSGNANITKFNFPWIYNFTGDKNFLPFSSGFAEINEFLFSVKDKTIAGKFSASTVLKDSNSIKGTGKFKYSIDKYLLHFEDLDASIGEDSVYLTDLYINTKYSSVSFNASKISSKIKNFRYFIDIPYQLYGYVSGNLSYFKKINANLSINAGWDLRNKTITDFKTDLIIKDNSFKKENIPFKLFDSPSKISIAANGDNFDNFVTYIYIDDFNTSKIIGENSNNNGSSPPDIPVKLSGKIYINNVIHKEYTLKNSFIDYNISNNIININKAVTNFENTKLEANGVLNLRSPSNGRINLQFNAFKIQNISKYAEKFKNRLFGIAKGKISLGFSLKNISKTFKGNAEFSITNGKMLNTGLQNALGIFLEPLKYKLRDLEFNTIYGNLNISGDSYTVNSFVFNSREIRMSVNGKFNGGFSGNLDINVEFNDDFIKEIPNIAYLQLNKYKSGLWYTIPLKVNGDITNSDNFKILK